MAEASIHTRAWFGPTMWLSFNVIDCGGPTGGASSGAGVGGGAGSSGAGSAGAAGIESVSSGDPADSAGCCTGQIGAGKQASRSGFVLESVDERLDLIDFPAVAAPPAPPLVPVHRAEIRQ